ncbi:MAG: four helix bundle protein [Patescibacteria group bacterium]
MTKKFDLEERMAKFGENIIELAKSLPKDSINNPLINQLVRSATSIGANYMEANGAESKKDFLHKVHICKKESKETMHWLRMLAKANKNIIAQCRDLWQEAKEFTLIFAKIFQSR